MSCSLDDLRSFEVEFELSNYTFGGVVEKKSHPSK